MELRHSYRLKKKVTSQTFSNVATHFRLQPRPTKMGRATKIKQERTSNFTAILDLPLDIMHEISTHLWPIDLLNLARTCKTIRKILTSRTSVSIWKAARKHYHSMIDPPEGISEPLYAHLTFDYTCDICDSSDSEFTNIFWLDRLSVCFYCQGELYVSRNNQKSLRVVSVLPRSIIKLLSSSSSVSPPLESDRYSKGLCLKWKEQYKKLSNRLEKEAWRLKTQNWVSTVKTYTTQFNMWFDQKQLKNNLDISELNDHVFANLKMCGFGEELEGLDSNWEGRLLDLIGNEDPSDLYRAWVMLKSPAISLVESARAERLLLDNLSAFGSVFKSHDFRSKEQTETGFPDHIEIATVGSLRNILHPPLPLTEGTFFDLFTRKDLHDALKNWEEATRVKVLQLMRDSLTDPNIKAQDLHLATTLFFCRRCSKLLSYPEACIHPCAFDQDILNRFRTLCQLVDSGKGATTWNSTCQIRFRKRDQQAAIDFLKMIDFTMNVTTDMMDEKDISVRCVVCQRQKCHLWQKSGHTFAWRDAILHNSRKNHKLTIKDSWKIRVRRQSYVK